MTSLRAGRPRAAARAGSAALAVALLIASLPLPAATPVQPVPRFRGASVTLNFVNADIEGVARAMAAILRQQFIVDPRVRG